MGPYRLSLLQAWLPGPDRRHGIRIDRQPVEIDPTDNRGVAIVPVGSFLMYRADKQVTSNPDHGNTTMFRPYSYILSTAYGSGVNAVGRSGSGYMTDALVLAARLDCAAASNLNLYGSLFTARRVSHGYGWGFIKPDRSGPSDLSAWGAGATPQVGHTGTVAFQSTDRYTDPVPSIPDNDLGWEINLGCDWNLLDSWTVSTLFGYWKPGRWFNYACIDRSVPGWNDPSAGNNWGVNPNRKIDPVFAVDVAMSVSF